MPLSRPEFGPEDADAVREVLSSGWLTTGPVTAGFERMLRERLGAGEVVAVSSCTAALHLSLLGAGIRPGDHVITTPITWPATANAIEMSGARPVFADVEWDTLNIDPACIEAQITPRTRAILPVHLAGEPADLDRIIAIAAAHGLVVVEDAAHAFGAVYRGRAIGSISRFTCFSFYTTKNLTTAEGGCVALSDPDDAVMIRTWANQGITSTAWRRASGAASQGDWVAPGFKYGMADLNAAIGVAQLAKVDALNERRSRLVQLYRSELADLPEVLLLRTVDDVTHANHLFIVVLRTELLTIDRAGFAAALRRQNIGTGVHYRGLHLQPFIREKYHLAPDAFPIATYASSRVLSLPLFPGMRDEDVADVAQAVRNVVRRHRRRRPPPRGNGFGWPSRPPAGRTRVGGPRETVPVRFLLHHPSPTARAIADLIVSSPAGRRDGGRWCRTDSIAPRTSGRGGAERADHLVLVFPIRGDDRIPDLVEEWIVREIPGPRTHSLCVTGDFRSVPPEGSVVSDEADRLLCRGGSRRVGPVLLLDTPIDGGDLTRCIETWMELVVRGAPDATERIRSDDRAESNGGDGPGPAEGMPLPPPLRTILSLLPTPPRFTVRPDGACTALSFGDGAPYERSVIAGLGRRRVGHLLSLVEELPDLTSLGFPFARLPTLPGRIPPWIRKLDLRGNSFTDYGFLQALPNLTALNLADCDLSVPPPEIAGLPFLETLVLAKNRIASIPEWVASLDAMRRLTAYRNLLPLVGPLGELPRLRLLNVGANPRLRLQAGDLRGLRDLNVLGLRLLGLPEVPQDLDGLLHLHTVDLSKNPAFLAGPVHPRIEFTAHMPPWRWDQDTVGPIPPSPRHRVGR